MQVHFKLVNGQDKRAFVTLKNGTDFEYIRCAGLIYTTAAEFSKKYDYQIFTVSDPVVRNALLVAGFSVQCEQRRKNIAHLRIPLWQIKRLDSLCETKYMTHTRSSLINQIVLSELPTKPPPNDYGPKKDLSQTSFTLNSRIEAMISQYCAELGRTRQRIIYDCICQFLSKEEEETQNK